MAGNRHEGPSRVHESLSSPPPSTSPPLSPNPGSIPYHSKYFDYVSFCNCGEPNQISYFNPKTREFYYHQVPEHSPVGTLGQGFIFNGRRPPSSEGSGPQSSGDPGGPHSEFFYPSGPRYHGAKYFGPSSMESGIAEVSFVILAFILWLYSFYRLYSVWQNTLNFSEASIQGPQGWDFLVNWILERVQLKRIKSIAKGRKCEPYQLEEGLGIELENISRIHPITSFENEEDAEGNFIQGSMEDETNSNYQPVLNPFQCTEEPFTLMRGLSDKNYLSQSIV